MLHNNPPHPVFFRLSQAAAHDVVLKDLTVHKNNQRKIQQALLKEEKKANAHPVYSFYRQSEESLFKTSLSHLTVYLLEVISQQVVVTFL